MNAQNGKRFFEQLRVNRITPGDQRLDFHYATSRIIDVQFAALHRIGDNGERQVLTRHFPDIERITGHALR
jgi:hypothetical protein